MGTLGAKGASSGRGTAFQSKACPPRPGAAAPAPTRKPLERRSGLTQKSPVRRAEAEAETGRPDAYSTLKRTAGPKRTAGKRRKGEPEEIGAWRQQAFDRVMADHDGWLVDEATGLLIEDRPCVHHPIEAGDLFSAGVAHRVIDGYPLVLHPDNAMVLSTARHELHHASGPGRVPIPAERLREETWALVRALDEGTGKYEWAHRMARDYA